MPWRCSLCSVGGYSAASFRQYPPNEFFRVAQVIARVEESFEVRGGQVDLQTSLFAYYIFQVAILEARFFASELDQHVGGHFPHVLAKRYCDGLCENQSVRGVEIFQHAFCVNVETGERFGKM